MKAGSLVFAMLFLASAGAAMAQARIAVSIRGNAVVQAGHFALGEIADISADDPALARRLSSVVVGASPSVAQVETLPESAVAGAVAAQIGGDTRRIDFTGSNVVKIRTASQFFDLTDVKSEARRQLGILLASKYGNGDAVADALPDSVQVPAGAVTARIRPLDPAPSLTGFSTVWVEILKGGDVIRLVPLHFHLHATESRVVTSQDVRPMDPVDQNSVSTVAVDAFSGACDPQSADARQQVFRRAVPQGSVVCRHDVAPLPAVRRGQRATLTLAEGGVRIAQTVMVLSDAAVGEKVRVRADRATGENVAIVIRPGELQVAQ